MRLCITHNGFHGFHTLSCRPTRAADAAALGMPYAEGGNFAVVSLAVAKRLNKACCGITSCRCGEGVAEIINDSFGVIPVSSANACALRAGEEVHINQRGYYPQG